MELFQSSIGVPPEIIAAMAPANRSALEAVAHTLVYDCMISDATSLELLGSVPAPTLVIDSEAVPHEDLAPVLTEFLED